MDIVYMIFMEFRKIMTSAMGTAQRRMTRGRPKISELRIYNMMNAPPPFSPTTYGNFHILPSPTALPAAASRTPIFEEKDFAILFYVENIQESAHTEDFCHVFVEVCHTDCTALCLGGTFYLHKEAKTGR